MQTSGGNQEFLRALRHILWPKAVKITEWRKEPTLMMPEVRRK